MSHLCSCAEIKTLLHFMIKEILQQNGVAERMVRTLLEKLRCMLSYSEWRKFFWAKALKYVNHLINRVPTFVIGGKTPIEQWSGNHVSDYNFTYSGAQCIIM